MVLMQPIKDTENVGRHQVLLVVASNHSEGLPPAIRRCFSHEVSMGRLTEEQRAEMLSQSRQGVSKLFFDVGKENIFHLLYL